MDQRMSLFEKINFALITSDSLIEKVPTLSSYESMSEEQFLDLINYSKDLVAESGDHKITFLVVAQGVDDTEEAERQAAEEAERQAAEEAELAQLKKQKESELRVKSKSILNSIYGV